VERKLWSILACAVVLATASPAVARTAASGPAKAGGVGCAADAGRTLAWLAGVRELAAKLGLPGKGLDWVSEKTREAVGADLLDAAGWKAAGLKAEGPICVYALIDFDDDFVVAFPVADEKRARDAAVRLFGRGSKPAAEKVGRGKAWRIGGKRGGSVVLAVADGVGYLAPDRNALAFLGGKEKDWTADLAFPDGDVSVVAVADVTAIGTAVHDDDVVGFAKTWAPRGRLEAVLGKGILDMRLKVENGGLLAMIAGAFRNAATPPDARIAAAGLVPERASAFVQLNVPLGAVLGAIGTVASGGAPGSAPAIGRGALQDLLASLAGDLTVFTEDGLVGLTLVASLADPAKADAALSGIVAQANAARVAMTEEKVESGGKPARLFRFGSPDADFRFPVFAAIRDGRLILALSEARVADAAAGGRARYVDRMDSELAADGLKGGALLVSHGFGSDYLGGLTAYAAALRGALSPKAQRWLDLFDLPALAIDLLYDSAAVLSLGPTETTLTMTTRFLGGDPYAAAAREKAWGESLRTKYSGRTSAWRSALWGIAGTDVPYGRKAKRVLLQPEPLTDFVLAAGAAGWIMGMAMRDGMEAAVQPAETPCQQYLMRACVGGDPEGPLCKDARRYFESSEGSPSQADEEECGKKVEALDKN
jgi:hypothetical protein